MRYFTAANPIILKNLIFQKKCLTVGPSTGYWKLLIKFDASRSGLGEGANVVGGASVGVGNRVPN